MSVTIYITGQILLDADMHLTKEQEKAIEAIRDGWEDEAFSVFENEVDLMVDQLTGHDPFTDGVMTPVKTLVEYAKKQGLVFNGTFEVTSEWQDWDNITVLIEKNNVRTVNTEILNAGTDELIQELKNRGYKVWKT